MSHPAIPDPVETRRILDFLFRSANAAGVTPSDVTIGSPDNPLTRIARATIALTSPGLWKRIGVGALGMLLIYWGVLILIGSLDVTQRAVEAVATKGMSELT